MDGEKPGSGIVRVVKLALSALGLLFAIAATVGFFMSHAEHGGGPISTKGMVGLFLFFALGIGCLALIVQQLRSKPTSTERLTKKETQYQRIMIATFVIGGIMGIIMAVGTDSSATNVFDDGPVSAKLAIAMVAAWLIILPIIHWYWSKTVDEQEVSAYRDGAYWGFLVYAFASPAWWMLWRGGLVPPINGPILYYAAILTCGVVWLRKKYA